jgi:hypothetical protein
MRRHWKLKLGTLDCTDWRTGFRRGYGPVLKTEYVVVVVMMMIMMMMMMIRNSSVAVMNLQAMCGQGGFVVIRKR